MIRTARPTITDHTNRAAARRQVRRIPQGRLGGVGFYLTPQQQAFYTAASTATNYGSTPTGDGGESYSPYSNSLENPNSTATTDLTGGDVTQYIAPQATAAGAAQLAQALGGTVVPLPNNTTWAGSVPGGQWAIQMPDGRILDATAVANVIGNDAAYPSAPIKAAAIANMVDARYVPISGNGDPQGVATIPASARTAQTTAASSTAQSVVSFTNLTSGGSSQARANADRWRISITGAQPGQVVSVTAHKDSGPESNSNYGTTDSAGNWSLEGTSSAADAGTWFEAWKVGGQIVGQIAITILPPAAPTSSAPTSSGTTAASGSSSQRTTTGASQAAPSGVNLPAIAAGIPWYAWLIGGALVFKAVIR